MQNYAFIHKLKCCPDLPPGSRITSALPYAHRKWMILFSLTGLSTEDGHPYLLLSMLYTVIGCKPEMHVFKKKNSSVANQQHPALATSIAGLWRTRCISTGQNVHKPVLQDVRDFYPPLLHDDHHGFPASWRSRKPLMLWKNPRLSTEYAAFTITTILYTSF